MHFAVAMAVSAKWGILGKIAVNSPSLLKDGLKLSPLKKYKILGYFGMLKVSVLVHLSGKLM